MPESNDIEPIQVDSKAELLVDAPAGAEAFASTEGHGSHHALVGVEKESINVGLILGIVLGTVVIVTGLVSLAFTMTEVTNQETKAILVVEADYPELREVRAAAATRLTQYDVVNSNENIFQIPIDQAINMIVNEQHEAEKKSDLSGELVLLPSR